jgi:predicted O-methyltransferase YrrM
MISTSPGFGDRKKEYTFKSEDRVSATTLEPELTGPELSTLATLLRNAELRGPHLEIGTAAGGTLRELILTYQSKDLPPFIVVDTFTYFPGQREIVERNLRTAGIDPARITFRASKSFDAVFTALKAGEHFSFIFIDAEHDAQNVTRDLLWTRMLDPGGFVCLHDYNERFCGVMWAVNHFLKRNRNYRQVALVDSLIVLQKQSAGRAPEISRIDLTRAYAVRIRRGVVIRTKRLWRPIMHSFAWIVRRNKFIIGQRR